jgi:hypothetical protein
MERRPPIVAAVRNVSAPSAPVSVFEDAKQSLGRTHFAQSPRDEVKPFA